MADQRAGIAATATVLPCGNPADLGHAGHQHALPRHREQPPILANPEEGTVAMPRLAPWSRLRMPRKRPHPDRLGIGQRKPRPPRSEGRRLGEEYVSKSH